MHLKQPRELRRSGSPHVIAIAGLALVLSGCGVTQTSTETIGTEGGVVSLESGLSLEVPAGALAQRTQVTVREQRRQGVIEIELEPRGLELAQTARLGWDDDGVQECERESGEWLQVERNGNRAQTRINRLERLRIRNRERCDGGACGTSCGECVDGGCGGEGCSGRCGGGTCGSGGGCGGEPGRHCDGTCGSCGGGTCPGDGSSGAGGGNGGLSNGNGNGNGTGGRG